MFEFTDEYLTGVELIDAEHKKLFEIGARAFALLNEEFMPDKYDQIAIILEELREYTKKHFGDEEAYMESIHYKRMFTQKIQHGLFIDKLEEMDLDSIDENQEGALLDILEFLSNWLIHHILEQDKMISQTNED